MSGLCGWFSREPAALPIGEMAASLCRFDQAPLRTAAHGMGAVALAGGLDCAGLYHEDGLLIAHWGQRVDALARLWRAHGPKACAALSGHFAFALLDEGRGEALLAVDRAGTRPLFWQQVGHTLVFASSADALAQHPGAGREVDPQQLFDYLWLHAAPTIYKGQRRLAPGEFVHMHGARLERGRYWRLRFHEHQPQPLPALAGELLDTLRDAVEASLGQQQAGVMLGGGAASAALAALLQAAGGGPVPTFSAGSGAGRHPGLDAARHAARRLGTVHHERRLTASDAADAIPRLAALFDLPCGDPAALAAYHCALLAREAGGARLLAAHGAEVLFARGARYADQLSLSGYERLPSALRQLVLEPLLFRAAGKVQGGPLAAARRRIEQSMQPLPARLGHGGLLAGFGVANVLDAELLAAVDASAPGAALEQAWWVAQGRDDVNRMIALELQHVLAGHTLPLVAKACELAGVEAAFPWLHDAMVAFAARLDPRHKRDGSARAGLLREALRGALGRQLAGASGHGFELPLGQWLLSDARLRSLAFDSLSGLRQRRIVRAGFIDTLLQGLPGDPARHARMVWLLMMLEQWFAARKAPVAQVAARVPEAASRQEGPCAC